MQHMGLSVCTRVRGGLSVHSLSEFSFKMCTERPPRNVLEIDRTVYCMYTMYPPEDEHLRLETCRGI